MPKGIKGFQKGHKSGMTGKHHSEESKEKIRVDHLGKKREPCSEETKRKIGEANRGHKHTEEWKKILSIRLKGKKQTDEHIKKRILARKWYKPSAELIEKMAKIHRGKPSWNKGIKTGPLSIEIRKKMSECRRGEKTSNWKGGITPINLKIRTSLEYHLWREAVFKRDNYTCICCGIKCIKGRKVYLQAHHIKTFSLYPKLRFDINNGQTLCLECHKKTDTYAGRSKKAELIINLK